MKLHLFQDKNAELQTLVEAAMSMVKSGDQEANTAKEKVEHLQVQITRLHRVIEIRIKLCLTYVSFHRLVQQVKGLMYLTVIVLIKLKDSCFPYFKVIMVDVLNLFHIWNLLLHNLKKVY